MCLCHQGKMVGQGTYAELSKSGVDFSELLKLSEDDKLEMSLAGHDKSGSGGDHETIPGYKRSRAGSTTSLDSLGDDYVVTVFRVCFLFKSLFGCVKIRKLNGIFDYFLKKIALKFSLRENVFLG